MNMPTLAKAVANYLQSLRVRNLCPATLTAYDSRLRDLRQYLARHGLHRAAAVTPRHLEAWAVELHRRGLSANVRLGKIILAKRFFRWLKDRALILSDPAAGMEPPKLPSPLPEVPPTAEELARLLDMLGAGKPADLRDGAIVEMLYGCLLRIGECLALEVRDVDLDEGKVLVRSGKGGKGRVVPLPVRSADAVAAYLAIRDRLLGSRAGSAASKALFVARGRGGISHVTFRKRLRLLGELAGIKGLHPHLLRHAGALHVLKGGGTVRDIQELLGHAKLETSVGYMRLTSGDLKAAYDDAFPTLRV
jgi:site-specific recombinase XerD